MPTDKSIYDALPERVKSLLTKLKTLSDRGIDGERSTAEFMLNRFLEKYGISIDDIEDSETKHTYFFSYVGGFEKLLYQIYCHVCDTYTIDYSRNKQNRTIGFRLTASQYAEMEIKFDIYKRAYKIEQEKLFSAFCYKNQIYPETKKEMDDDDMRVLTKEEVKKYVEEQKKKKEGYYQDILLMAASVKKQTVQNQIGESEE